MPYLSGVGMQLLLDILFCYAVAWITLIPIFYVIFVTYQILQMRKYDKYDLGFDTISIILIMSVPYACIWPIVVGRNIYLEGEF